MTELTSLEQAFQDNFSEEEIFDMIKDGMYQPKLKDFARNIISEDQRRDMAAASHLDSPASGSHQISCRLLFQKELTPSDVGKLNRLVIPKKYALKHFPSIRETAAGAGGAGYVDDAELVFRDRMMNAWKFRYCYWKSSQSFVFTRGWNRFVKEKELRAKDIITFYTCVYTGGAGAGAAQDEVANTFLLIDVSYFDCANGYNDDDKMMEPSEIKEELELRLGEGCSFRRYDSHGVEGGEEGEAKVEERGLRLFGVQIS
ncbi:hypothetical protein SAY87_017968 [Trapa incisa]|uniref:TF-B3 domain-containing protein n=1 Tax=Trapa incisa TaxID=236973 RepID=A0AAN7QUS5_9MYRT|nr:hypothetical protein SAY87_017968 [Trapa incisa]